ncbi:hypothetical protein [Photobacterium profundum]|nr:hypothetical protein [Photobacterium profundum]
MKVILKDGREFEFRHDINLKHRSLISEWSAWVDYVRKESKKNA